MIDQKLIQKYDVPAPRYTSYPTVPYWDAPLTSEQWTRELTQAFENPGASWALYMHIPFCESLCTFCGCNTSITKDHKKEEPYLEAIHKEWSSYLARIPRIRSRSLRELHIGGGTPTFLSSENLIALLAPILGAVRTDQGDFEASLEVDPRRTNVDQLRALRKLGFTRISMGVQDFDPEVQRLVNRIQPQEMTASLTRQARELGFGSVNFDLIHGLPKQTLASMQNTIAVTLRLKPDRIALYSYAHVPWIKPAQRLFTEKDLPAGELKRSLYEFSRSALLESGYVEIGMDHFALPSDSLTRANEEGKLHRNFMGYTSRRTDILLGLGVSAISESPTCFHQNEKALPVYERLIHSGELATFRGHLLTDEDRARREQILELMTRWKTRISEGQSEDARRFLAPLIEDKLVEVNLHQLSITELGKPFLRNVCVFFDQRMRAKSPDAKIFSQVI